jgi:hypothetical protein
VRAGWLNALRHKGWVCHPGLQLTVLLLARTLMCFVISVTRPSLWAASRTARTTAQVPLWGDRLLRQPCSVTAPVWLNCSTCDCHASASCVGR